LVDSVENNQTTFILSPYLPITVAIWNRTKIKIWERGKIFNLHQLDSNKFKTAVQTRQENSWCQQDKALYLIMHHKVKTWGNASIALFLSQHQMEDSGQLHTLFALPLRKEPLANH